MDVSSRGLSTTLSGLIMKLRISGRIFDTEEIHELSIRESQREVFVSTKDDFYRIKYRSEKDIEDVIYWKKLSEITTKDLHNALYIIMLTCEFFINSKDQCTNCPLFKHNQCSLITIPYNWREI